MVKHSLLESLHMFGNALLKVPIGKPLHVAELESITGLAWDTVWRCAKLVTYVKRYLPDIATEIRDRDKYIRVISIPPLLRLDGRLRLLAEMFVQGAVSSEKALSKEHLVKSKEDQRTLSECVESGDVIARDDYFHLSHDGILLVFADAKAFLDGLDQPSKSAMKSQVPMTASELFVQNVEDIGKKFDAGVAIVFPTLQS
jgi:hypothetical protein